MLHPMSDILAIVEESDSDEQLVEEIALRHPHRVTVLVEDGTLGPELDDSPRGRALSERLAKLLAAIEQRTGAVVVGLAGSREQLSGWRFDRIVGAHGALPAL
jgi:hypothetical protein